MDLARAFPLRTLLVLPLLVAATGCTEKMTESLAERVIESAASAGAEVDLDTDEGRMTITGEDGDTTVSTGTDLPEGFPRDRVDLVDATIGMSVTTRNADGTGWIVTMMADGDAGGEAVFDDAVARLEAKGFVPRAETAVVLGEMRGQQLVDEPWLVSVHVFDHGEEIRVQYVVVQRDDG